MRARRFGTVPEASNDIAAGGPETQMTCNYACGNDGFQRSDTLICVTQKLFDKDVSFEF